MWKWDPVRRNDMQQPFTSPLRLLWLHCLCRFWNPRCIPSVTAAHVTRWLLSCFQISKESPTRRYQLHMVFFTGKICQDRRWWKQWSKSGNEGLWLSNCHDLFLLHNNYFFLFFFSRQVLLVTAKDNMTILQKYMWYTQKVGKLIIDWIIICLMAI